MSYLNVKVVKKYAKVLFDLSCPDKLDFRHDELLKFLGVFQNAKEVLLSPVVSYDKKCEILNLSLDELNFQDEQFKDFIKVILDNKRLGVLEDILETYDTLVREFRSVVSFKLVVARELNEQEKKDIFQKLANIAKREINIDWVVDRSIIGGIIIKCNDKLLDASIKGSLERVTSSILV